MRIRGREQSWRRQVAEQAERHGSLFFRLAYGVVRDAAAAEDACQQALLKACERPEMVDSSASLRAWLARVVVNEGLQMIRRKKIERRVLGHQVNGSQSAAADSMVGLELSEAVVAALEKLSDRTRVVVALRIMNGVSGNEVSELLGCSAAEVSRQLHQGMEQLRELLADWKVEA